MFRSFTLSNDADDYELYRILNSPKYVIHKVDNYISESGMAGTLLHFDEVFNAYTRKESPYRREIKKFHMGEGGMNEKLDELLSDRNVRTIEFLFKFTEEGPVAVLDHEFKTRKTRR